MNLEAKQLAKFPKVLFPWRCGCAVSEDLWCLHLHSTRVLAQEYNVLSQQRHARSVEGDGPSMRALRASARPGGPSASSRRLCTCRCALCACSRTRAPRFSTRSTSTWPRKCITLAVFLSFIVKLELVQSKMAQKPVLRGEVGCACVAREVSVERRGMSELTRSRHSRVWSRTRRAGCLGTRWPPWRLLTLAPRARTRAKAGVRARADLRTAAAMTTTRVTTEVFVFGGLDYSGNRTATHQPLTCSM